MKQRIPFTALSDRQWDALRPYLARSAPQGRILARSAPQGRPLADPRGRMDAIFFLLSTDAPWRELPASYGGAATISRHFRRLTHAGLWETLLEALHDLGPRHPLQQLRRLIFRAARRAYRLRGLGIIVLARRLKLLGALPGPAWMLPDPDLSESLIAWEKREYKKGGARGFGRFLCKWRPVLRTLHSLAGGRAHIPRRLQVMMP